MNIKGGKLVLGVIVLGALLWGGEPGLAAEFPESGTGKPEVVNSQKNDVSPPLRDIPPIEPRAEPGDREIPLHPLPKSKVPKAPPEKDPVLQDRPGSFEQMPSPDRSFEGVNNRNGVLPPDTNGDVGLNHYVQTVNLSFAIWDKNGTLLYGPANTNTLWSGFGGPCEIKNNGDPIVLYDAAADRWLISQFALPNYPSGPFYECIAVSQTGDPTGAWYRYAFKISDTKMNDYPKFGVWPDAYYMSVNQFSGNSWAGAGAVAFEREKMLAGLSAQMVYFDLYGVNPNLGGMLPSDLDGGNSPPAGSPNYFLQFDDNAWGYPQDQVELWKFHVDWTNPSNSTFTGPSAVATPAFDSNMCSGLRNCIPQPGTTSRLDAIADRLMNRLAYRNFGSHESLVVNHTVDADGTDHAGIRWYELRSPGDTPVLFQAGTYAPDGDHRWMGSVAMDRRGNMALGYSVSSGTVYPSIRYTGRLAGDPLDTMAQGESTLISGSGSQTHSASRWGDYSMMAVDPRDDCTFWYTQEYYATTSSAGWQTRIGSFKFPSCSANDPVLSFGVSRPSFRSNDQLAVKAAVTPGPSPVTADVYVAVGLPDGTLLFLRGDGSFTPVLEPIVRSWPISTFVGQIFAYTFSGGEPVGTYAWLGAFTEPGTLNFIGPIVSAPFSFSP